MTTLCAGILAAASGANPDYGVTLPANLNLSSAGTGIRYIEFRNPPLSINHFRTDEQGESNDYLWNPNGYPADLFQCRVVHVSGAAPTIGPLNTWESMGEQYWRWASSDVGSISGAVIFEIKERATGAVLAQSDINAALTINP